MSALLLTSSQFPDLVLAPEASAAIAEYRRLDGAAVLVIDSVCSAPSLLRLRRADEVPDGLFTPIGRLAGVPVWVHPGEFARCPHAALVLDLHSTAAGGRPVLVTRPRQVWDPALAPQWGRVPVR